MIERSELRARTITSVGWTFVRLAGGSVMSFVVFAVLARLLTPADFGLFALMMLSVGLLRGVAFLSLQDAVVQAQELDEETADAAFWAAVGLGCAAGLLLLAAAPLYASLAGELRAVAPLQAMALVLPLSGLGMIHTARKLREFGHRAIALLQLCGNLLGGAAGIAAAAAGLGVWALAIQLLVAELAMLVAAWLAFRWMPKPRFAVRRLRGLLRFGGPMTLANTVSAASSQIEGVIVARSLGVADLGSLRVARRISDLVLQLAAQPFTAVSSVTLARLQEDTEAYSRALLRLMAAAGALIIPALWGLSLLGPELIVLLFGAQWRDAGMLAQLIGLTALPITVGVFVIPALAARGRSKAVVRVTCVQLLTAVAAAALAAPFGLFALGVMLVVRAHLNLAYGLFEMRRELGLPPRAIARALWPPALAAVLMSGSLLLVLPALRTAFDGATLPVAATAVAIGGAVYGLALLLLARRFVIDHLAVLRPLLPGGAKRAPTA